MRSVIWAACGTMFTLLMTTLGSALVFFFRRRISAGMNRLCMGFSGGVMSAAAVFSLLVPAAQQLEADGGMPWLVVTGGFLLGAGLILWADARLRRLRAVRTAGDLTRRQALLMGAVTLHNIPEGMAVGLAFALVSQGGTADWVAACVLALGIGIQNFPEGAAISLPMRQGGMSCLGSFGMGVLSGVVEPVFGVLVVLIAAAAGGVMPVLMALSAGAMMLVVMAEMIPEASGGRDGVLACVLGYAIMMALDIALG